MWAASPKKSALLEPIVFEGPGWADAMCTQSGFGERARTNHTRSHSGFTTHTDTGINITVTFLLNLKPQIKLSV